MMHNGDRDGSPEPCGLVSCGHWMIPMLWSEGRADKISNKLAGDIACLGGWMVEHQPCLLGSWVRFPAGAFAIFSVSAKASLPISLSLSPFPFFFPSCSFPFLFLSLSFSLRPFVCTKKAHLRIYPNNQKFANGRVRHFYTHENMCDYSTLWKHSFEHMNIMSEETAQ